MGGVAHQGDVSPDDITPGAEQAEHQDVHALLSGPYHLQQRQLGGTDLGGLGLDDVTLGAKQAEHQDVQVGLFGRPQPGGLGALLQHVPRCLHSHLLS